MRGWTQAVACGGFGVLTAVLLLAQTPPALPPATAAKTDFSRDIEPILKRKCIGCHNAQLSQNGLRLDAGEFALKGGYSGPVIVPGKSADSKLIHRVASSTKGFMMPPAGPAVTAAEVGLLRAWIDQGAAWPAKPGAMVSKATRPGSDHWAFQAVTKPAVPGVQNREWVRNPIDRFILARLERDNITPSPDAPKETLIRRVSFDLTGLPPSPAEVDAFVRDNRADAYERLVDRLLGSPHYGEQRARFWLDLAHYADSDGYEKDRPRPYSWRWRNWVIDAFNRNMPFDQFTLQQLAGDLLPNADTEQTVATGFYRNTLTNREAGVDRAEARFEQIVNRTSTVGAVFMGLTVGCAQCHDHKYDPISQKEFYQLFAYFDRAEEEDIDAPLAGELGPYLRARPQYEEKRAALFSEYNVAELEAEWEEYMQKALANPGADLEWDFQLTEMRAGFDGAERLLRTPKAQRTERQKERLTYWFLSRTGPVRQRDKAKLDRLRELRKKLDELDSATPKLTQAPVIAELTPPPVTHIAVRGDYREKGIPVEPGTLAILPPLPPGSEPNRAALARWLVSRDHPLTSRVTVNRLWQEMFGRGLVRTSEDFGTQGEKPSHPELRDWLAAEFMDRGWDVKEMLRLIVTSSTYRQSSHARRELAEKDPENALLARQSRIRLPAEQVRDAALAVSGLLNDEIGGPSVRPPQPAGLDALGYGGNVKWRETEGPGRYRRGLYIFFQRTVPYPQLMTFDAPDSNVTCSRRRRSNTPLQALNLLNDPVFVEAAQAFALRILKESPSKAAGDRISFAFRTALGRYPNSREAERLLQYFQQQQAAFGKDAKLAAGLLPFVPEGTSTAEGAAWVSVSRVLLNLDEFITRE